MDKIVTHDQKRKLKKKKKRDERVDILIEDGFYPANK